MAESTIKPYEYSAFPNIRYLRGRIYCASEENTVLSIITHYIDNMVDTGNVHTVFDVILNRSGMHYFKGIIYPDKDYGVGMYMDVNGAAYIWNRYNNVDTVKQITTS